jgi:hypothetical protein
MKKLILLFLPLVGLAQPVITPTPFTLNWIERSRDAQVARARLGFSTNAFNQFTIIASNTLAANLTTFSGGTFNHYPALATGNAYTAMYVRDTAMAIRGATDLVSVSLLSNICVTLKSLQPNRNGMDVGWDSFIDFTSSLGFGGFQRSESDLCYEYVDLTYSYYQKTTNLWAFTNAFSAITNALSFYQISNHLAYTYLRSPITNQTGWGFEDSVLEYGYILMPSVLRYRAYSQIGEMMNAWGKDGSSYTNELPFITTNLQTYLWDGNVGLFKTCTIPATNACHNIPGSAYAVVVGCVQSNVSYQISQCLLDLYADREFRHGMTRHLKMPEYFGAGTTNAQPFSAGLSPNDTYQSGGYWPLFTPWVARAMANLVPEAGDRFMQELARRETLMGPLEDESPLTWAGTSATVGSASYLASACCPRSYWTCTNR